MESSAAGTGISEKLLILGIAPCFVGWSTTALSRNSRGGNGDAASSPSPNEFLASSALFANPLGFFNNSFIALLSGAK